MYAEILRFELEKAELQIADSVQQKLSRYCEALTHWNKRVNLTGLEGEELVRRLVIEPVWIAEKLEIAGRLIDIGSGNGSPAVPMCLTRPLFSLALVEARTRRAAFLRHVATDLSLAAVQVHKERFEDVVPLLTPADWITMQAVAPNAKLLRSMQPLLKPTTNVVWITSGIGAKTDLPTRRRLKVPFSSTEVLFLEFGIDIRADL